MCIATISPCSERTWLVLATNLLEEDGDGAGTDLVLCFWNNVGSKLPPFCIRFLAAFLSREAILIVFVLFENENITFNLRSQSSSLFLFPFGRLRLNRLRSITLVISNVPMAQTEVPLTLWAIKGDQLLLFTFLEGTAIGEYLAWFGFALLIDVLAHGTIGINPRSGGYWLPAQWAQGHLMVTIPFRGTAVHLITEVGGAEHFPTSVAFYW